MRVGEGIIADLVYTVGLQLFTVIFFTTIFGAIRQFRLPQKVREEIRKSIR